MNDKERAEMLAEILKHWRGGLPRRASYTATALFADDNRYANLLLEIQKILGPQ
jgi:hypothetical protein